MSIARTADVTAIQRLVYGQDAIAMEDDLDAAEAAIVAQHDEELQAFLRGDVAAGEWRPREYARAVLEAVRGCREVNADA